MPMCEAATSWFPENLFVPKGNRNTVHAVLIWLAFNAMLKKLAGAGATLNNGQDFMIS